MSIRVSIYEDNEHLRSSLSHLIMGDDSLEFCGAYADCSSILKNCQECLPDVIIMDIDLPGISGIEATRLVKSKFPQINILIFTVFEDRRKVFDALCAGANGYMLKKANAIKIIEAITDLHNGGSPMTGEIARMVLDFFAKTYPAKTNDYNLSNREMDIVKCLVKGKSYKMTADACCIAEGTVRSHIYTIYRKLQVNSKSEVVLKAINERLIE